MPGGTVSPLYHLVEMYFVNGIYIFFLCFCMCVCVVFLLLPFIPSCFYNLLHHLSFLHYLHILVHHLHFHYFHLVIHHSHLVFHCLHFLFPYLHLVIHHLHLVFTTFTINLFTLHIFFTFIFIIFISSPSSSFFSLPLSSTVTTFSSSSLYTAVRLACHLRGCVHGDGCPLQPAPGRGCHLRAGTGRALLRVNLFPHRLLPRIL